MFQDFANVWTPVVDAARLKNKPLPVVVAGEKVVFFRDGQGKVGALLDRCPHRGVALSLGKVNDGCLECPFHAWQFDATGACQHVPLNPDAKRERLFATSFPAREIGGLLWLYTAAVKEAPSEPMVPESLTRTDLTRVYLEVEWDAHWTRAMENMLDSPHVPYVHAATIGRGIRPLVTRDSRMEITWEEQPFGGTTTSLLVGVEKDNGARLDFYKPNMMVLHIPIPGRVFRMHAICVPIAEKKVRMIIVGARDFMKWRVLNPIFRATNMKIVREDEAVVTSSQPVEVPPPAQENSVRTDKATLQFRKYYYETLKQPA